jgi:uncharacterized protein VirK/YbjX
MMNTEDVSNHGRSPQKAGVALLANLAAGSEYLYQKGIRFAVPKAWQGAQLLFSLPDHFKVLRVLSHPQTARLARENPLLAFKYLGKYVALRLPLKTRRSIFLSHFQFLQRTFRASFLDSVARLSPTLWHRTIEQKTFHIAIELKEVLGWEGELRLDFSMTGRLVYRLIFVFAAGRDFNLQDETIIVISSIQGVRDFDRVKMATKTCYDIQPAHILMAALGGLAEAAHVSTILGLHQSRQVFCNDKLFFSYEKFFEGYGNESADEGIYFIPVPYFKKPVLEIKASHRRRSRKKRLFKADVRDQTVHAIQEYLG